MSYINLHLIRKGKELWEVHYRPSGLLNFIVTVTFFLLVRMFGVVWREYWLCSFLLQAESTNATDESILKVALDQGKTAGVIKPHDQVVVFQKVGDYLWWRSLSLKIRLVHLCMFHLAVQHQSILKLTECMKII